MAELTAARYPEKALQLAATQWLRENRGYIEIFADEEARGARVDCVGLLDSRLALIEVKVSVGSNIVDHRPDRAHSLESKIAGALGPLYRREPDPVSEAANRAWDRQSRPLMVILAQAFGGLNELKSMLARRSREWHFDYEVWRWTGHAIDVVASELALIPPSADFAEIPVPVLIGRTPRAKARTISELLTIAAERGVGDLVSYMVDAAPTYGLKIGSGRWTIALKRVVPGHDRPQMVIGAYLDASSPSGLAIGCWCEALGIDAAEIPGEPTGRASGFLNTNRIVRSVEEVDAFLRKFACE